MDKANLVVTYDSQSSGKGKDEVNRLMKAANEAVEFLESPFEGTFLLRTTNPKEAVTKIAQHYSESPDEFEVTKSWVPIDEWCKSEVDAMAAVCGRLSENIGDEEKWKLRLHKRQWKEMEAPKLIIALTDKVEKRHVDLKNPDKIIAVEIFGEEAGISLLTADQIVEIKTE